MARDDGFRIADVQTTYLNDAKVKRLWWLLEADLDRMNHALMLHLATILASWESGRRRSIDEAAPVWLAIRDDLVGALIEAKLLDAERRIPARSWSEHFGPARRRKTARVESGRLGGLASGKARRSDASATPNPSGRQAGPSSPSVLPDRPAPRARPPTEGGGRGAGPKTLREAMGETPFTAELERRRSEGSAG